MSDMIGNIIALLGVIVTGYFTFLVYKATQATAAATEATLKLSEELATKEDNRLKEHRVIMRRQLIPQIINDSEKAYNAVVDTDAMNIHRKLVLAPISLSVNKNELAQYFSDNEIKVILKAWETYEDYRSKYYKMTYPGDEINTLLEKNGPVIQGFSELMNDLKNIKFD